MPLLAKLPQWWERSSPWLCLLRPLAWLHGASSRLRLGLYARGVLSTQRLEVPVVVVGNRVVGGAGKTPVLLALVDHFSRRGWHPGVVSRGYGGTGNGCRPVEPHSSAHEVGDEPLLIRRRAGVPVWVGKNRVQAARALLAAHPATDVLLSDDGLQHLRLGRDVEVIVFDERGAGNGALLPAGPLREPVDAPPRGRTTVVLYNSREPSTTLPGFLAARELHGVVPLRDWWRGQPARPACLAALRGQSVVAAAGIARPQRFFAALREAGLQVDELALPDHFDHAAIAWPAGAAHVVVTEKDAVKLDPDRLARLRPTTQVWVAPLELTPEPGFFDAIEHALESANADRRLRIAPSPGGPTTLR